jgi:hypothetical protein
MKDEGVIYNVKYQNCMEFTSKMKLYSNKQMIDNKLLKVKL